MKLTHLLAASLLVPMLAAQSGNQPESNKGEARIVKEVRHELVTLPY
jgi:hypothetical protein